MLLARADIARRALADGLRLRGADVDEVAAYRTVTQPVAPEVIQRILVEEPVDAITFTSSSTVRGVIEGLTASGRDPRETLRGVTLAAIGPITAATLREYGLEPALVAEEYTIPGLVAALAAYFAGRQTTDAPPQSRTPVDGAQGAS
jgi:uroporphyrinogen-III synthase